MKSSPQSCSEETTKTTKPQEAFEEVRKPGEKALGFGIGRALLGGRAAARASGHPQLNRVPAAGLAACSEDRT